MTKTATIIIYSRNKSPQFLEINTLTNIEYKENSIKNANRFSEDSRDVISCTIFIEILTPRKIN